MSKPIIDQVVDAIMYPIADDPNTLFQVFRAFCKKYPERMKDFQKEDRGLALDTMHEAVFQKLYDFVYVGVFDGLKRLQISAEQGEEAYLMINIDEELFEVEIL